MAVFPDRIVLKNSTDSQAAIEAAIQTGGADEITQGEIVLGINPASVQFYTKAGDGSIVTLGGTSVSTLGGLTDVDLSTPATDGQVIAYNAVSGNWEPVDPPGGSYTDPLTTDGDIVIRSGGVTTRLGIGASGQVLTVTNGIPSWENATGGATSIDDLADVDTSTTPPTTGQVLEWDGSNWVPATSAAGGVTSIIAGTGISVDQATGDVTITATGGGGSGAVDSVNGETGVVSLGIQDMDDYELNDATGTGPVSRTVQSGNSNSVTSGGVGTSIISFGYTYWAYNPDGSAAETNVLTYLRDSASFPINVDINGTIVEVQEAVDQGAFGDNGGSLRLTHSSLTSASQITGTTWVLSLTAAPTLPLVDGDVLQWNNADQKFKPAQPTIGGRSTASVTSSSLADGAGENLTLAGTGKAGQLLAIEVDKAAWVTVYCNQASRAADAGRSETEDPSPGSGVLVEAITTGSQQIAVTPAVNYFNLETVPATELYLKVVNKSGTLNTITTTLLIMPVES